MTTPAFMSRTALDLRYPMSLGTYGDYDEAQRVVDHLSDHDFPVQYLSISGTGLRSIERVTGRLTRGKLALAGALSGLWMGLFIGVVFAVFSHQGQLGLLITTPLLGAIFGLVWSQLGFSTVTRRGARDFSSVSQVLASEYEVLVEHRFADQARTLVATMPSPTGRWAV